MMGIQKVVAGSRNRKREKRMNATTYATTRNVLVREITMPVVFCKDCKHYEPDNCEYGHCRMYWFNMRDIGTDGMIPMPTGADDFCSRGERRDEKRR